LIYRTRRWLYNVEVALAYTPSDVYSGITLRHKQNGHAWLILRVFCCARHSYKPTTAVSDYSFSSTLIFAIVGLQTAMIVLIILLLLFFIIVSLLHDWHTQSHNQYMQEIHTYIQHTCDRLSIVQSYLNAQKASNSQLTQKRQNFAQVLKTK